MYGIVRVNREKRFVSNVLWSWAGVVATIAVALVLPPLIISHAGFKSYTLWMFALSFLDYFWLGDFGVRSATINFCARHWATRNYDKIAEVVSTAAAMAGAVGLVVFAVIYSLAPAIARFFQLDDPIFVTLLRMVSASWAVMLLFTVFSSCLEGCQRFDLTGRAWLASLAARVIGILAVIDNTGNLILMGWMVVLAQLFWCVIIFGIFRRELPEVRVSLARATWAKLRLLWDYGVHTFLTSLSNFVLGKSIQPMIVRFLGAEAFGVYFLPRRLLDYAMEGVGRVGMVTAPSAAELMAAGRSAELLDLAIYANRYSFALFAPAAAFLLVFGEDLLLLWLSSAPESARQAATLLPAFLLGQTIVSGQFNSASVLFGIGRHRAYSRFVLAEGLLIIAANLILLPSLGLGPAVWVSSLLMALNRGLIANLLVTRELGVSAWDYAARIYSLPLGFALAELLFMALLRPLMGQVSWIEIGMVVLLVTCTYVPLMVRFGLSERHRMMLMKRVSALLPGADPAVRTHP